MDDVQAQIARPPRSVSARIQYLRHVTGIHRDEHAEPDELTTFKSTMKFAPLFIETNGDKIYKLSSVFGVLYGLAIKIPWWISSPHLTQIINTDIYYFSCIDKVTEKELTIILTEYNDRRGQPRIHCHNVLMRFMCDANWFTHYSSAMYYSTAFDNFQMYVVVPEDFKLNMRFERDHLMEEFKLFQAYYSLGSTEQRLTPLTYRVFAELIRYLSRHNNYRSLASYMRGTGLILLRRLFLLQEVHLPTHLPSLQRISTVTVALCVRTPDKVPQLPLPSSMRREVMQLAHFLVGSDS